MAGPLPSFCFFKLGAKANVHLASFVIPMTVIAGDVLDLAIGHPVSCNLLFSR
jgi:hypothetical protein